MAIYLTNHHSSLKCERIYSFVFKGCWFILSLITINTTASPGPDKSSEIQSSHLSNVAQENRSRRRRRKGPATWLEKFQMHKDG